VSVSEDFKPMVGSASYNLSGKTLLVEADERVDIALLGAALECVAYLSTVLSTVSGARRESRNVYMSDVVTLYLGARIHGVSAAGIYLVALGLGKEAIHMERSQYEFFFKLFYYDHRRDKAADFVDSIPRSARDFAAKARYEWNELTGAALEDFNKLPTSEPNFRSMRDSLIRDRRFNRNFEDPLIGPLLRNSLANLRDHWLWGSNITHASNLDLGHVVVVKGENSLLLNIDSRHTYPNRAIADFGQRCFITAIFAARKFGIEVGDEAVLLGTRLKEAADRHLDEPISVHGLFDFQEQATSAAICAECQRHDGQNECSKCGRSLCVFCSRRVEDDGDMKLVCRTVEHCVPSSK